MTRQHIPFNFDTVPLSKSMVLAYEKCPHRFELDFILNVRKAPSPEMQAGTDFHDAADAAFKNINREKIVDEHTLRGELMAAMPTTVLTSNWMEMEVKRFAKLRSQKLERYYYPIATEQFMRDPVLNYYGTVDRIDPMFIDNGEHFMVCDYKTGKVPKAANYMTPYLFELAGYRHLVNVSRLLPREVDMWCLIFPRAGVVLQDFFKGITITSFYKKVHRVRELIKQHDFRKKMTPLCEWCPHAQDCLCEEDVH